MVTSARSRIHRLNADHFVYKILNPLCIFEADRVAI